MNTDRKTCTRCVMDTSDSSITFNEHGVCDHCVTFDAVIRPKWLAANGSDSDEALAALADRIRKAGEGRRYDCIIGMSGGIDSSYLVYLASVRMGLRPLVFHIDTGWNSQEAVNNIERVVVGLELDLFTEVIDWEEMRDVQLAFFRSGVPHIDTPQDHAIFATMYRFAEKYGVRYILTGANLATECIRNPVEWMYYQSDAVQLRDIHRKFGDRSLKTFPTTSIIRHKLYLPYLKGIKVVRPLNLVPYVKEEAMQLLAEKFGWQPYPQKHFESRFTRFYEGYWLPQRFGFDTRRVQYSSLILTGQMTRDEAVERLSVPALDQKAVDAECDFVAKKLRIPRAELDGYMAAPKRTFRDYKSQFRIYEWGAKAMKRLGLEIGGKR